jgi:hypothetical protein
MLLSDLAMATTGIMSIDVLCLCYYPADVSAGVSRRNERLSMNQCIVEPYIVPSSIPTWRHNDAYNIVMPPMSQVLLTIIYHYGRCSGLLMSRIPPNNFAFILLSLGSKFTKPTEATKRS